MTLLMQQSVNNPMLIDDNSIDLFIPGYTRDRNAVVIKLELLIKETGYFKVETQGRVATRLEKIFKRNIEILSSLKKSYGVLKKLEYRLVSSANHWKVNDARSAGLPLCIALVNVLRKLNGFNQIRDLTGTGILRIDGSFEASNREEEKKQVIEQLTEGQFINSEVCNHVFDLANLMNC